MEPKHSPKVLLLLEATLGGTGRHVLDLSSGLMERGYSVHLLHSDLRSDQQFRCGLRALKESSSDFHEQSFPITRHLSLKDLKWWWQFSAYVRKNGPFEVIHAHSTKAGFLGRLLWGCGTAARLYTPHAFMMLDPTITGLRRMAVAWVERGLARLSDAIVVISAEEQRCALRWGIPAAKMVMIPNGVNVACLSSHAESRETIRDRWGISSRHVCIGVVGRLCDHKHPELALEAFAKLVGRSSVPVALVMMGEGSKEAGLKELSTRLGIERFVIWTGLVDARSHMAGFDVLAHTSRFEGLSYVFLEALASGVPIVTMRVGGVDELVQHGRTGLICDRREPEAFADALCTLVENPELRAAMSTPSRQLARHFDLDRMIDQIEALYRTPKMPPVRVKATATAGNSF